MADLFAFIEKMIVAKVFWAIPLSYVAGLALSLSPCSLPMVPVIMGIAEIEETGSRKRALGLSLLFVFGLVIAYIALGLAASFFGVFFGVISKHFISRLLLGLSFIFLALVSFDLVKINLNTAISINTRRFGLLGVFLLGIIVGISITACVLPVLGAILLLIAQKQDIFFGVTSLMSFALGMGTVYLAFAMGGRELIVRLEKIPGLMSWIKKIMGLIILVFGLYYLISIF